MAHPVVHLELHTPNLGGACSFYRELLGWTPERLTVAGRPYHALDLGAGCSGGVVECDTERALWLPYAEVGNVVVVTARARDLGARVILEPREGPGGVRSVLVSPSGGEVALWQPRR